MSTQPNNDTLHAQSLTGGSLAGVMQATKTEKGTIRTLRAHLGTPIPATPPPPVFPGLQAHVGGGPVHHLGAHK
jgi:hypothetical protein